jgi:glutathione S-transferase
MLKLTTQYGVIAKVCCIGIIQLTVADLACFDILDKIIPRADNDIFQSTPSLKEHYKKVMTHPRVQAWLEKRPKTEI